MSYGTQVVVHAPYADTVQRVRDELQAEGFGVLTEIDMRATMRAKLGEEIEDYVILGACNPPLAHRALQADRSIGCSCPATLSCVRPTPGRWSRLSIRRSWSV